MKIHEVIKLAKMYGQKTTLEEYFKLLEVE